MRRLFSFKAFLVLFVLVAALLLALWGQEYRVFERAWFNVRQPDEAPAKTLWLDDYRVVREAQVIEGLDDDVSALTYDPLRKSLFTLTNQHSRLIELSLEGKVLRQIELVGFGDPEAVEYIAPGLFVIADERPQRLVEVRIDDATTRIDAADGQQLSLGLEMEAKNRGFEGLAYDLAGKRLFVAKERDPLRIYEVHGFPHVEPGTPSVIRISDDRERDAGLFLRDLSSLQYDARSGHLLALSDDSRLLVELDAKGEAVSSLSLIGGQQGLKESVPQAEGIAMDENGVIYMISEPNLFYTFSKKAE
ncbi:SdiA-regulated domain-containing protein [Phytopseudomonas dryadis]|uniref:DNA-binding protein n=1 Tax=Phytopseudomonas dryadis TaxID=2487520 RepID=A0A4Q9R392_9GAMM|nr:MULTISPECIES: SdiA-regulated domain-containing protein [Pseudomonas]TBU92545.1 DNA-binding protein [Pseudomonas dryadis]TBV03041.1 DNA-binding protein [Pseudomonas dryadis]TBV17682.1 DNA-binding protein [Pseudomonas sp. FRB 230]